MIRFACPGCTAVLKAPDTDAGKQSRCPKCETRFVVPAAETAPAALSSSAADAPVEIQPCPKCGARLTVAATDLGVDIECPYCQAVYAAKRAGTAPPPPTDRPSRRREEPPAEDRPSRRRPAVEADEEDDDRPRRRPRDDDDEDNRPRKKKKKRRVSSSEVDTVARWNYILGGLQLLCGCLMSAGSVGAARDKQEGGAVAAGALAIVGVLLLLFGAVLIVAGVGVSKRQSWGRTLTFITAGVGLLSVAVSLLSVIGNLIGGNAPGAGGGVIGIAIWTWYGIQAIRIMQAHADEFE